MSNTLIIEEWKTIFKGLILRVKVNKSISKRQGIDIWFGGWPEFREIGKQPKLHEPKSFNGVIGKIGGNVIMNASDEETPNNGGQSYGFPFSEGRS